MKTSKTIFLLLMVFVFLFFTGAACVKVEGEARRGIFKSVERADRWFQKTSLLSLKAGENIGSVNATVLEFDPLDSGTLYLGTKEHGLFLSINAGDSWQKIERLPQGKIKAILPHPKNSAEVYVAVDQKIFRSGNCCRTWENLYLETKEKVEVTALAIDPFFNQIIYAGLSDGRLIKSENRGYGWNLVNEFKAEVKQILVNPQNPSILYVVISNGFFKSEDKGKTWLSLGEFLKAAGRFPKTNTFLRKCGRAGF